MDTYEIVIRLTIDVPNHVEALKTQKVVTDKLNNLLIENIAPVSKITVKMIEK